MVARLWCMSHASGFHANVHRSAVLTVVRTHFPSPVPWVCCYRYDESIAPKTIASTRGVQQGALFGLAFHSVIAEARRVTQISHPGSIDLSSSFLVDGL